MVLLTYFSSLLVALGAAASPDALRDACLDENSALKDTCTGVEDAASHFLQLAGRSTRGSSESLEAAAVQPENLGNKVTSMTPLNCTIYNQPIQVYKDKESGDAFEFAQLDVLTGQYSELFDIPQSAVTGGFTVINACGVNPKDNIIYCAMYAKGSWIVRVDETAKVEFVARLPQHNWNTADFGPTGAYFVSDPYSGMLILQNLHKKKGYTDKTDKALWDLRKEKIIYPPGWRMVADMVVSFMDIDNKGTMEYMMSLYGPELQIAQYNLTTKVFSGSWVLKVVPSRWDLIYGAGWNFQGKLFFAANNGAGVYQIPIENLTLTGDIPLTLSKTGPSMTVEQNDGMSCMTAPDPWKTKMEAFDCKTYRGAVQLMKRGTKGFYDVMFVNMTEDGEKSLIFSIPLNMSGEGDSFTQSLNGVGIGPKDSIPYGVLMLKGYASVKPSSLAPVPHFVVRFNDKKYEYVAKVMAAKQPISGCFDKYGSYYFLGESMLYKIPKIDTMKGYENWTAPELPIIQYTAGIPLSGIYETAPMADMVAIQGNFDKTGETTWILSISMPAKKLVMVKPEDLTDQMNHGMKNALFEKTVNGYEELSGDCFGTSIGVFTNTSGSECAFSCNADINCRGFMLEASKSTCTTRGLDCERQNSDTRKFYQKVVERKSATVYYLDIDIDVADWQKMAFGAAFQKGRSVFFSSDDGAGVFRVPYKDITLPPEDGAVVKLEKVAKSTFIMDTDGMNCFAKDDAKTGMNKRWFGSDNFRLKQNK